MRVLLPLVVLIAFVIVVSAQVAQPNPQAPLPGPQQQQGTEGKSRPISPIYPLASFPILTADAEGTLTLFRWFTRGLMTLLLIGTALAFREIRPYPVRKAKVLLGFLLVFFSLGLLGSVFFPVI